MAVAFTSNIGLAKPSESELALLWTRTDKLQEDNNLIIIDKMDVNQVLYTPTLVGATSNPNVGAGSIRGEYQEWQGFIFGTAIVMFTDPSVAAGSGEYGISLPFPADGAFHTVGTALSATTAIPGFFSCIGEGYTYDASSGATSGTVAVDVVTVAGVSYGRLITETFAGKTNQAMTNTMPFVVATNDRLGINFVYKKV